MEVPSIHIAGRRISADDPCFVIGEAGVNHNGKLEMALELVDAAADAGADAVKFQKRDLKSIYPKHLLDDPNAAEWSFQYMLPMLKEMELSTDEFRQIKQRCSERGILFMCTPWDNESLDLLEELDVQAYKVASADLTNMPLLERIASKRKPMIISTGMSTQQEIERTASFLKDQEVEFAILHCCSTYPAPFEDINLAYLNTLKGFGVPIGYSGHERGIMIPVAARVMGCCIIEKHITLDRTLPGPDHAASLEPHGFVKMVRDLRNLEAALGTNQKHISSMEALNRELLRKSLVAARDLKPGETVTKADIAVKGPGKGVSPQRMDELIGIRVTRAIQEDEYFIEADLKGHRELRVHRKDFRHPWGFKVRHHDFEEYLHHEPPLVEFHFSEDDLDREFVPPEQPYSQQLFVHAPEFANRRLLNFCSTDPEVRERSVKLLQRTVDKVASIAPYFAGPPVLVIHTGGMSLDEPDSNTAPMYERALECYGSLDPKGVILLPENLPPRPWYLGGQWYQNAFMLPEEMVEFCKAGNFEMTFDVSHAQLYCNAHGRSLIEYAGMCLPYTRHVHVGDANGIDREGLQVGEGGVDWDELMRLFADEEFTWVPEIWSGHLNGGEGFITAINRLSRFSEF